VNATGRLKDLQVTADRTGSCRMPGRRWSAPVAVANFAGSGPDGSWIHGVLGRVRCLPGLSRSPSRMIWAMCAERLRLVSALAWRIAAKAPADECHHLFDSEVVTHGAGCVCD
jgi:hypothetical protein